MLLDAPLRVALGNDNNVCTSTHILCLPHRDLILLDTNSYALGLKIQGGTKYILGCRY